MRLDPYRREPVVAGVDVLLDDAEDRSLLFGSALPDASAEYVLYDDERDADGSGGAAISTISELGILRVSTGEHRVICRGSSPALDPSRRNAYFLREESLQLLRDWTSCLEGSCEPRLLPLPAGEWGLSTLLGTPMTIGERFIYLVAQDHMEGDLMLYRLRK
jgi:hypothetical protein